MSGRDDERSGGKCPRCGSEHAEPGELLCRSCRNAASPGRVTEGDRLTISMAPVLREALASAGPGEDLDEALLRALKAHYPAQATALLPALTQIIEMEAQRAEESKQQTVRRLAGAESGPQVTLRTSVTAFPDTAARTVSEASIIRIGDKEYGSLEEMPPDLRRMVEAGLSKGRVTRRVGCASMLLGGLLVTLLGAGER